MPRVKIGNMIKEYPYTPAGIRAATKAAKKAGAKLLPPKKAKKPKS